MQTDPCIWAIHNRIKLMGGTVFTLDGCRYIGEIMRDEARHIVVMKGTQARITTLFMLRAIHSLIYRKYPKGVIYYFPTEKDVEEFSKTRFGPLISDNPCIRKVVNRTKTNSVFIKRVGDAMLSLKGGSATRDLEGKKDSGAVRSTPADEVIRDERCSFNAIIAKMTVDRLLDSDYKKEVDLGSPTVTDFGTSKVFGKSDQKFHLIKCEACGKYTSAAEDFPNSIKFKKDTSHDRFIPYMGCVKCDKEIYSRNAVFVPKCPDKYDSAYPNEGMSGYHVSYFSTAKFDPSFLMDRYDEAVSDDSEMGGFYNTYLGLPHSTAEERLERREVFDCCGDDLMQTSSTIGTAMAADIMKMNRVVIAEKKANGGGKIIYMARMHGGFDALFDLAMKFNVKSVVACLRPYEEKFREFQARCQKKGITAYGSQYATAKMVDLFKDNDTSGIYTLARTDIMDKSQTWVRSGKLEIPRNCDEVKVFVKEVCNTVRYLDIAKEGDPPIARYKAVGDGHEHYRHCLNYLIFALMNLHDYQIGPEPVFAGGEQETYNPLIWGL